MLFACCKRVFKRSSGCRSTQLTRPEAAPERSVADEAILIGGGAEDGAAVVGDDIDDPDLDLG